MEINHKLKAAIEQAGVSQRELAEAVGVREETVSRWVNGRLAPSGANLVGVLRFLQGVAPALTIDDIFAETPVTTTSQAA